MLPGVPLRAVEQQQTRGGLGEWKRPIEATLVRLDMEWARVGVGVYTEVRNDPAMQAAELFIDPAGTHCAGATDGEIAGDAPLSPQSRLVTERAIMAGTTSLPCTSRTSTYAYLDSGKSLELFASARYEQP